MFTKESTENINSYFDTGQKNKFPFPKNLVELSEITDNPKVEIVRSLQFFYVGQKGITLNKLKEFFTDKAIQLYEHDGYIKFV